VTFTFKRPNEAQRLTFLKPVLEELGFSPQQIQSLATATGATHGRTYGYTYSDLAHAEELAEKLMDGCRV
jgi:hypothetical protein